MGVFALSVQYCSDNAIEVSSTESSQRSQYRISHHSIMSTVRRLDCVEFKLKGPAIVRL